MERFPRTPHRRSRESRLTVVEDANEAQAVQRRAKRIFASGITRKVVRMSGENRATYVSLNAQDAQMALETTFRAGKGITRDMISLQEKVLVYESLLCMDDSGWQLVKQAFSRPRDMHARMDAMHAIARSIDGGPSDGTPDTFPPRIG